MVIMDGGGHVGSSEIGSGRGTERGLVQLFKTSILAGARWALRRILVLVKVCFIIITSLLYSILLQMYFPSIVHVEAA